MSRHGFGIIGCGMIAEFHARAINDLRGSKVVAAYSRNESNAKKISDLVDGCDTYDNLSAMLDRDDLDIVCICTPSGAHLEPAVAAARAGKHVVVEKPLEVSLKRCDKIIAACDKAGVRLCTIFPSRFGHAIQLLKEAIDTGKFGRLTLGDTYVKWWRSQEYYDSGGWRGTWKLDGGGALMNQAIHNVDLLYSLMGEVKEISAFTDTLAHKRIEVEDVAVATLRFVNGALGTIEASTSAFPGLSKRTEIHGTQGSVAVEQDDLTLWQFEPSTRRDKYVQKKYINQAGGKGGGSDPRAISYSGHLAQLKDFVSAIDHGTNPLVDGREGRKSVEIILAIYQSAATGKAVKLPLKRDPTVHIKK